MGGSNYIAGSYYTIDARPPNPPKKNTGRRIEAHILPASIISLAHHTSSLTVSHTSFSPFPSPRLFITTLPSSIDPVPVPVPVPNREKPSESRYERFGALCLRFWRDSSDSSLKRRSASLAREVPWRRRLSTGRKVGRQAETIPMQISTEAQRAGSAWDPFWGERSVRGGRLVCKR